MICFFEKLLFLNSSKSLTRTIDLYLFLNMREFKSTSSKQNHEELFLGMILSKLMKKIQMILMKMIKYSKTIDFEDLLCNLDQILELNVILYSYVTLENTETGNTKTFSILIIVITTQCLNQSLGKF